MPCFYRNLLFLRKYNNHKRAPCHPAIDTEEKRRSAPGPLGDFCTYKNFLSTLLSGENESSSRPKNPILKFHH